MNRATPVEMRQSLETADAFKQCGVRFVPMPVFDDEDHKKLIAEMYERLEKIEEAADE